MPEDSQQNVACLNQRMGLSKNIGVDQSVALLRQRGSDLFLCRFVLLHVLQFHH
jgi:hypothetical protein